MEIIVIIFNCLNICANFLNTLFLFMLVLYGLYNLQEKFQFIDSKKAMFCNHKVKKLNYIFFILWINVSAHILLF